MCPPSHRSDPAQGGARGADAGEFQSPALESLVRALQQLPGLGRKSATRIALFLVDRSQHASLLTTAVEQALRQVTHCGCCGAITEADPCAICTSDLRDPALLCIVASPVDVLGSGPYFVSFEVEPVWKRPARLSSPK